MNTGLTDSKIVQFNDFLSYRFFKIKDGYLLKGFLNANAILVKTKEDLGRMGISLGSETNEEYTKHTINLIKAGKVKADFTDLDLVNTTCNLQCEYCSVRDRDLEDNYKLPTPEIIKPILEKYNIRSCNFIGGECLTEWEDMQKLCLYLKNSSVEKLSIFTNGRLLDSEKLDFLSSLNKVCEVYIPIYTSTYKAGGHYTIDEFYERHKSWFEYSNIKFTINLIVGSDPFDADYLIEKLGKMIGPSDNVFLVINSMMDRLSEDQLRQQLKNYESMIVSPYLDTIVLNDDRSEYIGTACSGFNISACSGGYSTCSMATLDKNIKPYSNIEDVSEIVDRQIMDSCSGCPSFFDEDECEQKIRNKKCIKLNAFNCYFCPDLGRCSYLRCTYRIAIQKEDVDGTDLSLACMSRLLSRLLIEYLNEKDRDFDNKNWLNKFVLS